MLQERTEDINMVKDYEDFKKFVLGLTGIDLNAYKRKADEEKNRYTYSKE